MKTEDQYLVFIRWSEEDSLYLGYCPDLFPYGAACHSGSQQEAYRLLCDIISETVADAAAEGRTLPEAKTRPMRELEVAGNCLHPSLRIALEPFPFSSFDRA